MIDMLSIKQFGEARLANLTARMDGKAYFIKRQLDRLDEIKPFQVVAKRYFLLADYEVMK